MRASRHRVPAGDAIEACYGKGWTDGLPVVPPTPELVAAMIGGRDPERTVAVIPPLGGQATVEKVAACAVMAGCRPEYFPVVLTGLRALTDPAFNLNGVQATTHVASPVVIVSGPVVERLGLNAGFGLFGSPTRANATIGRALRLVLLHLGGAWPGQGDMSTFGNPGKPGCCIAERMDRSPWPPLHADRGLPAEASAVTVFAGEAPHSIVASGYDRGILLTAADTMATLGGANLHLMGEMLLVVGPEHAGTLAAAGWSRGDVQAFLFEHARRAAGDFEPLRTYSTEVRRRFWPEEAWDGASARSDARIPIVRRPEDILVMVGGGDVGRFSVCCPGWGDGGRSVTRLLDEGPAGEE